MLYLNQLKFPDIPYEHNLDGGGAPPEKSTVAAAGCGPCCLCMMVENLTTGHLDLMDCLAMSAKLGANRKPGTDLKILGKWVAEGYGLDFSVTDDIRILAEHLRRGGMAVANSGGDREGYKGIFTHGGHYMAVVALDGEEVCILDPSYFPGKFDEDGRRGKVKMAEPFIYCSLQVLKKDCENRSPAFYFFKRKSPVFYQ